MSPIILNEPFRAVFYAPFYAALLRGAFARQGLDLSMVHVGDPGQAAQQLIDGVADLAWSGPMRPMQRLSRDPQDPLRCFGAVVMKDPFLLLTKVPRPGFRIADLAKLKLAVTSEVPTPWWCLQDDIRRAGLDPKALDLVLGRTMAQNSDSLLAGEVDVVMLFEPFAAALEEKGASVCYASASRGPTSYSAFYATRERIKARRAEFQAIIRAMAETQAWIKTASAAEIAATVAPRFQDVPQGRLQHAIARYQSLGIWCETPHFPADALARLAGAMISSGAMTHHPGYDLCVDAELVESALAA
ncbi:MAG: ABC transporter substrate-binding protein [Alphaproteobacteria bacterium]|nr:ABC transporter substrate-binding protein [Alphaproteobacteria bacterium]